MGDALIWLVGRRLTDQAFTQNMIPSFFHRGEAHHPSARTFGTVFGGKRYFTGALVARDDPRSDTVEWRNELFERVDGATAKRLDGAQLHARARPGARETLADRSTTPDDG